jgi:hypothetical protein
MLDFTEHAKLAVHLVVREGLEAYLPLKDMVDISTEIERVSKRLTKLQSEYDGLMKNLASPNVIPHIILMHETSVNFLLLCTALTFALLCQHNILLFAVCG